MRAQTMTYVYDTDVPQIVYLRISLGGPVITFGVPVDAGIFIICFGFRRLAQSARLSALKVHESRVFVAVIVLERINRKTPCEDISLR